MCERHKRLTNKLLIKESANEIFIILQQNRTLQANKRRKEIFKSKKGFLFSKYLIEAKASNICMISRA